MEKAYVELDKEGVGYLTYDDLADKFIALGVTLSKGDLVSLAADIDTDNDKKISKVIVTCTLFSSLSPFFSSKLPHILEAIWACVCLIGALYARFLDPVVTERPRGLPFS